jgi:hypothetical protein
MTFKKKSGMFCAWDLPVRIEAKANLMYCWPLGVAGRTAVPLPYRRLLQERTAVLVTQKTGKKIPSRSILMMAGI